MREPFARRRGWGGERGRDGWVRGGVSRLPHCGIAPPAQIHSLAFLVKMTRHRPLPSALAAPKRGNVSKLPHCGLAPPAEVFSDASLGQSCDGSFLVLFRGGHGVMSATMPRGVHIGMWAGGGE